MMKFFKMGELARCACHPELEKVNVDYINAKLEREGKRVYCCDNEPDSLWNQEKFTLDTHQALLINIEPIQKCEHPKEKVNFKFNEPDECSQSLHIIYECECGARVEPREFKEVRE